MSRTEQLFAAVYEVPDDDSRRQVLADHLQELGDPRGEFIALQLAHASSPPSAAAQRREQQLVEQHGPAWLGPLGGLAYEPRWARGFLDEVSVELPSTSAGHPMWSTVRRLRLISGVLDQRSSAGPLGAGCFRSLRALTGLGVARLEGLLAAPVKPPLQSVQLLSSSTTTDRELALLQRLVELPELRELELALFARLRGAQDLDWLWTNPLAGRLERLALNLNMPFDPAGCLRAVGTRFPRLQRLGLIHNYFEFAFERGGDGRLSALTVSWNGAVNAASYLSQVAAPLRALPDDALTSFRFVQGPKPFPQAKLQRVMKAVARQKRLSSAS